MRLAACLHARDEAPYLAEWISYHVALGIERIWVYDNGSADRIDAALAPYRDHVELIRWPRTPAFPSSVEDCLTRARAAGAEWLVLIDADEFIVPEPAEPSGLREELSAADRDGVAQVLMPWHLFTSNGHVLIPNGRVVDNYTSTVGLRVEAKAAVRVSAVLRPGTTHQFEVAGPTRHARALRLNHYRNKSAEDGLMRTARGFVDEWGICYGRQSDGQMDRLRHEEGDSRTDLSAARLSARFGTAATQRELGVEPVKVVIWNHNQVNGPSLRRDLGGCFRDLILLDSGSDAPPPEADVRQPNLLWTGIWNYIERHYGGAEIVWGIPSDIRLLSNPIHYKYAIVSAYPFGIWSPRVVGKRRGDQNIPSEPMAYSVRSVEGIAWALSRPLRQARFPLEGSPLGWGHDLILSQQSTDAGYRNLIDGRVAVAHEHLPGYCTYNSDNASHQMHELIRSYRAEGSHLEAINLGDATSNLVVGIAAPELPQLGSS